MQSDIHEYIYPSLKQLQFEVKVQEDLSQLLIIPQLFFSLTYHQFSQTIITSKSYVYHSDRQAKFFQFASLLLQLCKLLLDLKVVLKNTCIFSLQSFDGFLHIAIFCQTIDLILHLIISSVEQFVQILLCSQQIFQFLILLHHNESLICCLLQLLNKSQSILTNLIQFLTIFLACRHNLITLLQHLFSCSATLKVLFLHLIELSVELKQNQIHFMCQKLLRLLIIDNQLFYVALKQDKRNVSWIMRGYLQRKLSYSHQYLNLYYKNLNKYIIKRFKYQNFHKIQKVKDDTILFLNLFSIQDIFYKILMHIFMQLNDVLTISLDFQIIQHKTMEQNQPKIQQNENYENEPEEWSKLRLQYSNQDEALDQLGATINLIEKWIWIKHQFQFQSFQQRINQKKDKSFDLKVIIKRVIEQAKINDWKISQKYSMSDVQALIQKVRILVKYMIENEDVSFQKEEMQEEKQNMDHVNVEAQEIKKQNVDNVGIRKQKSQTQSQKRDSLQGSKRYQSNSNLNQNYSSILPQIKPKGKLYNPQQLTSSFVLAKQIKEDYQIRSPYMFKSQKPTIKQLSREGVLSSKYLKMTFKFLCKQQYFCGGLFDDFAKQADKMNMNKWMVFCKQFQFIQKFHKKDLIQIYQTATKFSSTMTLDQFLIAVSLLKEKYVQKFHEGDDFINDVLQLGNQASYKSKISNFKVTYNGPKRNSFQFATYFQSDRLQIIQKQKQFKKKKRQRQLVLIKGMYPQHLLDEINKLKQKRQQKTKTSRLQYSLTKMQQNDRQNSKFSMKAKTNQFKELNYSKIFQYNKNKQNSSYNTSNNSGFNLQDKNDNLKNQLFEKQILGRGKNNEGKKILNMNKTQFQKEGKNDRQNSAKPYIQARTFSNVSTNKPTINPQQNPIPIKKQTWLTNIRTDTQQSDQILKEHLQIQKRIKNRKSKLMNLMDEMNDNSKKVQQIKNHIEHQNQQDEDRDMIETQANFRVVK